LDGLVVQLSNPEDEKSAARPRGDLQRDPLGSQIASALRRDIYLGRLRPGTRLGQQELCEEFATSRMPVRDALRELVHDGLLTRISSRQLVVAPLSRNDLLDSFMIEGTLNGLAARLATTRADEKSLDALAGMHAEMLELAAAGNLADMAGVNWRFHRTINHLADSRKLIAALRIVSLDVPRDYLVQMPAWAKRSNIEHGLILDAMRAGDAEKAEKLMTEHLTASGAGLADHLVEQGFVLT
jgi:DNA-binding GntR family transcriptional regulator